MARTLALKPSSATHFRVLASVFSVVSYLLMTYAHTTKGVCFNLVSQILLIPFAMKHKAWDMIFLSALFAGVNLHYLAGLLW